MLKRYSDFLNHFGCQFHPRYGRIKSTNHRQIQRLFSSWFHHAKYKHPYSTLDKSWSYQYNNIYRIYCDHFRKQANVFISTSRINSNTSKNSVIRSPYNVLQLKRSASKAEIKDKFRKLAKENHPDLNPQIPSHVSQSKMADLIHAYSQLMDDDFLQNVGDERVALACEMFTLQELKIDRFHDVYTIQIQYDDSRDSHDVGNLMKKNVASAAAVVEEVNMNAPTNTTSEIVSGNKNSKQIIIHRTHPDDSISDIKRQLQSKYMYNWGLEGRRLDRDKIAIGWEIVCQKLQDDNAVNNPDDEQSIGAGAGAGTGASASKSAHSSNSLEVMSYHLFLRSYDINDGDIIYAIVRKNLG